ncbi:MAG: hypothetical protein K6A65_05840 [Succinivibrionaceae bacterium]|nr:hypothetical protein [Succinivibrionaceae bacterium]
MRFPKILTLLSAAALAGCGFHLPNETSLSEALPEINMSGNYQHAFFKEVQHELEVSGVKVNVLSQAAKRPKATAQVGKAGVPAQQAGTGHGEGTGSDGALAELDRSNSPYAVGTPQRLESLPDLYREDENAAHPGTGSATATDSRQGAGAGGAQRLGKGSLPPYIAGAALSYEPEKSASVRKIPELVVTAPSVSIPVVSADSRGQTLEYNIMVRSHATLRIPGHRPIVMQNQITRVRVDRAGRTLVTQTQDRDIINETYRELARQLIMRLSYLGRQSDPDSPVPTPAQLTIAHDDPTADYRAVAQDRTQDAYEGKTLIEMLQDQDEREAAEADSESLDDLNNGNALLDPRKDYHLPRARPVLVNQAPELLEKGFDISDPGTGGN